MIKRHWFVPMSVVLVLGLTQQGCNFGTKQGKEENSEKEEQKSEKPGFFESMKKMGEAAKKIEETAKKTKELAERKPVDPINFRELLATLPEPPEGWENSGNPDARTVQFSEFKYSLAERGYKSTNGNVKITLKVTDGAYIPYLYAAYNFSTFISEETLDYYKKGVNYDGMKGMEEYYYKKKRGNLNLMVYERFIVEISASGIDDAGVLKEWLNRMDLKKLSKWAEESTQNIEVK